uniref:MerR family transcriptional regulator n=1 Tax=uncultured Alistipes sp. TaxID=538949 RepID=UPI00260A28AD
MAEKLYYSMGEVSEMFDVKPSLLRHWESQFPVLRPKRNKKGNRLFTPQDVENLKLIYHLVKERGMTLDGARKALRSRRADKGVSRDAELMERLQRIRALLVEVREDLKAGEGEVVEIEDSDEGVAEMPVAEAVAEMPAAEPPVVEVAADEMPAAEAPVVEVAVDGMPAAETPAVEVAVAEASAAEVPVAAPRRKAVVKIVEQTDGEAPAADAPDGVAPARRPTRRPRRGKKEE